MTTYDLDLAIGKSIHLAVEKARGISNKTILKGVITKLVDGIREGNLQDEDINSLLVQLEDYIIEGDE
jgi:hypothetical protein